MKSGWFKVLSLALVLTTVLIVLAGCGASSTGSTGTAATAAQAGTAPADTAAAATATEAPAQPKTITGMVWGTTESVQKMDADLRIAYPDLDKTTKVEWIVGGQNDSDVANKIRLALSSGDSPADFIQLNYTQIPEFAEAGALTDLTNTIAPYKDQLLSGALNLSLYKGKTIAVPAQIKAKLWFYRKDMFDAAGIDPSKVKTADDFIAAGKALQAKYPKSYIWNFGKSVSQYDYFEVLSGTDASFVDADGNYIVDTEPNVRKMLETYRKINEAGIIAPITEWTPDWEKAFSDGTIASSLCATWLAENAFLPKYAAGQEGKWAVAQWPSFIGETGGSEAGGAVYVVPTFSKEPALAEDYLTKAFLTKEGSLIAFKDINDFPVNKEAAADPSVQAPNAFFGASLPAETVKSIETLKPFNYTPAAAQEISIVNPYFDKAVNGTMTVDAALKAAEADLKNQIGNAYAKK